MTSYLTFNLNFMSGLDVLYFLLGLFDVSCNWLSHTANFKFLLRAGAN